MEHILVVDDDPGVRRLMRRILEDDGGYAVSEAADGQEALDLVRNGDRFDLIVSDIVMPRLNGVQLMEVLSAEERGVPVILVSGYAPAELAARGISAPCAVLAKPFTPERLLEEVRRCLPART